MRFSLILSTLDRIKEVDAFLASLTLQTFKDHEVIIVDQNLDNRLTPIIEKYQDDLQILHIRSAKGLSLGRNKGMQYASGDVLAFPDDDCTYPAGLLENVAELFHKNDCSILMGKTIEKESGEIVAGKVILKRMPMQCSYFGGSSTTLFIDVKEHDRQEIAFDERFGIGARFHSEEENDLVMSLLKKGWKGIYDPDMVYVFHPKKDNDLADLVRANMRGQGLGALIAKHLYSWCGLIYFFKYNLVRPLGGIMLSCIRMDQRACKFYLHRYTGIWSGFFEYIKTGKRI